MVWSYIIELNKSMISHERNLNASRCANQISSAGGEGFISPWDTPDQQKARPITHLPVAEVRVRARVVPVACLFNSVRLCGCLKPIELLTLKRNQDEFENTNKLLTNKIHKFCSD